MGTILRDLSLVLMLVYNCIIFMRLYDSRFPKRKTNIITALFIVPLVALNMANVIFLGIETIAWLVVFTCILPSLIFFFIMSKTHDTRFLFTFCVVDTIVMEVLFVSRLLDTLLGLGGYVVMFISRLVLMPLIDFFIVKYLRKPYHQLQRYTKKGWGIFSFMAALFYATMMVAAYYPTLIIYRPEYFPHLILILILVPIMYITVFNVLWKQLKLFLAAEENRILNMQINMIHERLSNKAETENSLKLLRHDIKHRILPLNDYIKSRDFEKAQEYMETLIEDIDKNTLKTYCANNSVNAVLSYYNGIADLNGIEFAADIQLPEKLSISETDFAVILSNGIENAINALSQCDDKRIDIKAFVDNNMMYLEIKNPFRGEIEFEDQFPLSTKENHGFGTKSMAALVKKHGGIYSFVTEDGCFVFRCAM